MSILHATCSPPSQPLQQRVLPTPRPWRWTLLYYALLTLQSSYCKNMCVCVCTRACMCLWDSFLLTVLFSKYWHNCRKLYIAVLSLGARLGTAICLFFLSFFIYLFSVCVCVCACERESDQLKSLLHALEYINCFPKCANENEYMKYNPERYHAPRLKQYTICC